MINYHKYLPVSKEDESWGLCVVNTGNNRINPNTPYPSLDHPSHHYFSWNRGRNLSNEYQIIYITKGSGLFESDKHEQTDIKEGSIIILFPQEWHRFKPDSATGWDEYWIGFNGPIMDNLVKQGFFLPENPIINAGIKESILTLFLDIIEHTKQEKTGYQPAISGAVLHLLGEIHAAAKQKSIIEDNVELIVNKACVLLRENVSNEISIQQIAEKLNIGYSRFRKIFKEYTLLAPGQYLIQLKIEKAKALLSNPDKTIKEIAFALHFESSFYFSKIFKQKTGLSPKNYRKQFLK